jgi:prevent-host-death family protein
VVQLSSSAGDFEATPQFVEVLGRVAAGEEVTITQNGAPLARLVPVRRVSTPAERRAAFDRINELAKGVTLGGLKIKDLINEGRR